MPCPVGAMNCLAEGASAEEEISEFLGTGRVRGNGYSKQA